MGKPGSYLPGCSPDWLRARSTSALPAWAPDCVSSCWWRGVRDSRPWYAPARSFAFPALVVLAPWYLKNVLWLGDPVYPFLSGSEGVWGRGRLDLLMAYLRSFGGGESLLDYLLVPLRLYTDHALFSTFMSTIEFPSVLFLLLVLWPFSRPHRGLRLLAGFGLLRFGIWTVGSQQTRFLLPLFPALSVLTAGVLLWIGSLRWVRPYARILAQGIVGEFVAVTLAYQVIYFGSTRPAAVVLGGETRRSFLARAVYDFQAVRYVVEELPEDARVLMLWDGQSYYCDERCLPDTAQSRLPFLLALPAGSDSGWPDELAITHLLLDLEGANFMLQHDPSGRHAQALAELLAASELCSEAVASSEKVILLTWHCALAPGLFGKPLSSVRIGREWRHAFPAEPPGGMR